MEIVGSLPNNVLPETVGSLPNNVLPTKRILDAQTTAFYIDNHTYQTYDFVKQKKQQYSPLKIRRMSIWEAMRMMDDIIDESDPDLHLSQSYHAFQTAEAMRKAGEPDWMIVTGLIHDLGKILIKFGEPQWAAVGDIHPVGCRFSEEVVLYEAFKHNPDYYHEVYSQPFGVYEPHCGLNRLHFSFSHDWYLWHVLNQGKTNLPEEALYIIRYHSFYALHSGKGYRYFMNDYDHKMLPWLQRFQQYDLYSKNETDKELENKRRSYYEHLVRQFIPSDLNW